MHRHHEDEFEYRFGDSGPKYLLKGPRASMGVVVLKPGEDFSNHYHNVMEENFFILEGEIEFVVDGAKHLCKKGDFIHVEPQESHYLINRSETSNAKAMFFLAPYQNSDKVVAPL